MRPKQFYESILLSVLALKQLDDIIQFEIPRILSGKPLDFPSLFSLRGLVTLIKAVCSRLLFCFGLIASRGLQDAGQGKISSGMVVAASVCPAKNPGHYQCGGPGIGPAAIS
jgi:hypothetical protein